MQTRMLSEYAPPCLDGLCDGQSAVTFPIPGPRAWSATSTRTTRSIEIVASRHHHVASSRSEPNEGNIGNRASFFRIGYSVHPHRRMNKEKGTVAEVEARACRMLVEENGSRPKEQEGEERNAGRIYMEEHLSVRDAEKSLQELRDVPKSGPP